MTNWKKRHFGIGKALMCALFLILSACGGGGGGATPAASVVPPYTVTGKVTVNGAAMGQVTVTLSGAGSVFSDANGDYAFAHLSNGSYTVTPSRTGYLFTPASQTVTVSDNAVQANFSAAPIPTYTLGGKVTTSTGAGLAGATLTVKSSTGAPVTSVTSDGSGNYSATGIVDGDYLVTVSHTAGFTFAPASRSVTVHGAGAGADFSTADVAATHTISGKVAVSGGGGVANVTLTLISGSGATFSSTVTDAAGAYTLGGVPDGLYAVKPSLAGYGFVQDPLPVGVSGADAPGMDITAAPAASGGGTVAITL